MSGELRSDIEMQVVHRDGKVHLLFSRRDREGEVRPAMTDNMILPPDVALLAAECITTSAFEADTALKPVGETLKASLVEQHREKLVPRVALMLGSLRQSEKSNGEISLAIMEAVCSEIFS